MAVKIKAGIATELTVPENLRIGVNAIDLMVATEAMFRFDPPLAPERRESLRSAALHRLREACTEQIAIRTRGQKRLDDDASMQRHVRLIELGGSGSRVSGGDYGARQIVRTYVVEIDEDAMFIETVLPPKEKHLIEEMRRQVEAGGPRPVTMALMELALHTKIVEDHYAQQGEPAYQRPSAPRLPSSQPMIGTAADAPSLD